MTDLITMNPRTAEFLLSEARGQRSREALSLAITSSALQPGQILSADSNGDYQPFVAPAAGESVQVAILWEGRPASTGTQGATGIVRDAELLRDRLTGLDSDAETALAAQGLILR